MAESSYIFGAEVYLRDPIGMTLDKRISKYLDIGHKSIKLENIVTESDDLEVGLNCSLKMLERIVNRACVWYDRPLEYTFVLSSEWLDGQFDLRAKEKELEKRGEFPKPYGVIHAKGTREAENIAEDLVPVYVGRDKTYLYDAKKLFRLLPRDFVMKLLACSESSMIPEQEFSAEERKILDEFVMRGYLKKRLIMKATHYYDLDAETRKHLLASLHRQQKIRGTDFNE